MRYTSLGSGSEGNALVVEQLSETTPTRLMVDCGFSLKEIEMRLQARGIPPESLSGILVTHEHGDHIGGVFKLALKYDIPTYLTTGTHLAVADKVPEGVNIQRCDSHAKVDFPGLSVQFYPVPHDAREPVQFVFSSSTAQLGVLTDVGAITPHIQSALKDCDALVLEANHCHQLLHEGPYPYSLKKRVGGGLGHLSNQQAADLLRTTAFKRLHTVHAAHISKTNNHYELAVHAFSEALGWDPQRIGIAAQEDGFDWIQLSANSLETVATQAC